MASASTTAQLRLPGARLTRRLRNWLAPRCALCGLAQCADAVAPVCSGCRQDFFAPAVARCQRCAIRLPAGHASCGPCLRHPPVFDATLALTDYLPPVDGLVLALKFGHRLDVAALLGGLLAERLAGRVASAACLLPVPLAFERHAERGFNQAEELARRVATHLQLPLRRDVLLRVKHGPRQEDLSAEARRRNVRDAFAVATGAHARIEGAEVVVVDDVMTSGATLDAVARALKRGGAARVVNAVVARTP